MSSATLSQAGLQHESRPRSRNGRRASNDPNRVRLFHAELRHEEQSWPVVRQGELASSLPRAPAEPELRALARGSHIGTRGCACAAMDEYGYDGVLGGLPSLSLLDLQVDARHEPVAGDGKSDAAGESIAAGTRLWPSPVATPRGQPQRASAPGSFVPLAFSDASSFANRRAGVLGSPVRSHSCATENPANAPSCAPHSELRGEDSHATLADVIATRSRDGDSPLVAAVGSRLLSSNLTVAEAMKMEADEGAPLVFLRQERRTTARSCDSSALLRDGAHAADAAGVSPSPENSVASASAAFGRGSPARPSSEDSWAESRPSHASFSAPAGPAAAAAAGHAEAAIPAGLWLGSAPSPASLPWAAPSYMAAAAFHHVRMVHPAPRPMWGHSPAMAPFPSLPPLPHPRQAAGPAFGQHQPPGLAFGQPQTGAPRMSGLHHGQAVPSPTPGGARGHFAGMAPPTTGRAAVARVRPPQDGPRAEAPGSRHHVGFGCYAVGASQLPVESSPVELVRSLGGLCGAVMSSPDPAMLPDDLLCQLHRVLSAVSALSFHAPERRPPSGRGSHHHHHHHGKLTEDEDTVDRRRALLAPCLPMILDVLPLLPLDSFRAGCEKAIQALVNLLRSRDVKAVALREFVFWPKGSTLLGSLHQRLARGGILDCNICIKVARCLATVLWSDGDTPPAPLVHAIGNSPIVSDLATAAVMHRGHSFTLARVLDCISTIALAEAAHSAGTPRGKPRVGGAAAQAADTYAFVGLLRAVAAAGDGSSGSGSRRASDEAVSGSSARSILRALGSWD